MLCPLVGLAFALFLYYKNQKTQAFSKTVNGFLGTLRFAVVTVLCFLLLEPLVRYLTTEIESPIIVVATDNSSSMVMGPDSVKNRTEVSQALAKLNEELATKFEVANYSFGQTVNAGGEMTFADAVTDFSGLFSSLSGRYANRNVGAIVILSDGIYNRGRNPRYAVNELQAPVYTIGVGDTTQRKDALIAEVAANRIAFLGNKFPVEALIQAKGYDGTSISYSIEKAGKVIEGGSVDVSGNLFEASVRFLLDAKDVGLHQYVIRIAELNGEVTYANNRQSVFVDVIDSRQKIQIVAHAPHPDIAALRSAIGSNDNYEVEVVLEEDFKTSDTPPDLLILHQIPSQETTDEFIETLKEGRVPFLAVVGMDTDLRKLDKLGVGARMGRTSNNWNDAGANLNEGFTLFKSDASLTKLLVDVPPLKVPFGTWSLSAGTETMLYQKIGQIATDDPLLVFGNKPEQKSAALLGEGIWRWRLYNYAKFENHEAFDSFVASVVQYLSLKEDKRLFRIFAPTEVMENERLIFNAELYNAAYQPINNVDALLQIEDADGNEFPFTFSPSNTGYRLDAGALPVGNYNYRASVVSNGETLAETGNFAVLPFALEGASLTANHQMLYNISSQTGGQLYTPAQVDDLVEGLLNSDQVQARSFSTEVLKSVMHFKWIFFLLLLLLSAEWIMRKRAGHY